MQSPRVTKLLMVYYTLGNIDPKFRSKLAAIRLLAIAKANDIDEFGVDGVLQRINEDLQLLYNGVKIQTRKGEMDLFGAVVSVCGDTLAEHKLAGFSRKELVFPIVNAGIANVPLKKCKGILMKTVSLKGPWKNTLGSALKQKGLVLNS